MRRSPEPLPFGKRRRSIPKTARASRLIALAIGALAAAFCATSIAQAQTAPAAAAQTASQTAPPGQITAVPNRPTFATTAESVQRGVLEIEYGFEGGDGHQDVNGLVKFGLFKNLELRFANNPFQRDDAVAGTGDSGAGFKWRIYPQRGLVPTISALYAATIATANHGLGAQAAGHSAQLLLSKDFGRHHFDFNEGVQFVGRPQPGASGYNRNYFTALSWSHPLRDNWSLDAEIAGFSRTNASTPATMTILLAPAYNVSPRLVLDAGVYVAAYGNLPRVTFFCGVTYSIADLYRLARR